MYNVCRTRHTSGDLRAVRQKLRGTINFFFGATRETIDGHLSVLLLQHCRCPLPIVPVKMAKSVFFLAAAALASALVEGRGGGTLNNPCLDNTQPFAKQPWCDPTLDIDSRVKDMIGRMNMSEKIPLLNTNAPGVKSLGKKTKQTCLHKKDFSHVTKQPVV